MTKKNKILCLDEEVTDRLEKEGNMSSFVNDLLKDYFDKHRTSKDLIRDLKKLELQEEYDKKLKEVENGN